ncbi:YbaB/EbfC family nucleoid-associated protein [Salinispora arenicola]|uniref:YbaB/EbfC family nucleoid-associated protein n=1 Tax=Salinispora arenicola TaxID=168697 RepID=UPI00037771D4|nr:YbaB/EbfC family nucleoid-associated protein [Salinispora arenicola]
MQPEMQEFIDNARSFEQAMRTAQADLEKAVVAGRSRDKTVTVLVSGLGRIHTVRVDPGVFDQRDAQALQNAITEAIRAAAEAAGKLAERKMGPIEITLH